MKTILLPNAAQPQTGRARTLSAPAGNGRHGVASLPAGRPYAVRANPTTPEPNLHPARLRRCAGFNLIEVVVALAVVSIGVISILGLIPQAMESGRSAFDRTIAATIVQDMFADLRQQSYPPSLPSALYFDADGFQTTDPNNRYFRVDIQLAAKPGADVQVVNAIVSWRDPNPLNSDIFITEIAKYIP